MEIVLKKWGNSRGIILPKAVLKEIGITDTNASFSLKVNKNKEIILKRKKSKLTINSLFEGFDYKEYWSNWEKTHPNQIKEDDWGEPVGKETF